MLRIVSFAALALLAASAGGPVKGYFGLATPAAEADDALPKNCSRLDAAAIPPDWMASVQEGLKLFAERPAELVEAVVHTEGPDGVHGRQLQATTCTPTLANGIWTGSPPNLNAQSFCGYFYWTGSYGTCKTRYLTTSWTGACNDGYYRRAGTANTGTCTGGKTCCYDPGQGYAGSCTHVCTYNLCPNCCYYCCKCTNSYSFTPNSPGLVCDACFPPAAANAANPTYAAGTKTYTWACAAGYYGAPIQRSCSNADGSWSGSPIACNVCPAPAAPANGGVTKPQADTWAYACNPGYYWPTSDTGSSTLSLRCNSNTGAMTAQTGSSSSMSCSACTSGGMNGYYCTGTDLRRPCPGGTFGTPGTLLSSAACSGTCTAGYFCPQASTSSTAFPCGGADKYCPAGSASPTVVTAGFFTTPLSASALYRTGQAPCPSGRSCVNGVIQAGIALPGCSGNRIALVLPESAAGAGIGDPIVYSTPGATGMAAAYSVVAGSLNLRDPGCPVTEAMIGWSSPTISGSTGSAQVVMNPALNYAPCQNGFTFRVKVARSDSAASAASGYGLIEATCTVDVTVLQVARPPVITDCSDKAVDERSIAGTLIGGPILATNPNVGTSLLYYVNYTLSAPSPPSIPLSIGMCDGQLRVLRPFLFKDVTAFRVYLTVRNDGSAIGIGSSSSFCELTVNVRMKPLPPELTVLEWTIPELKAPGYVVGNTMPTDPNNYTVVQAFVAPFPSPNAFAIDASGTITTTAVIDTLAMGKYQWSYNVNASNGFAWAITPVSINVVLSPRPPAAYDSRLLVREDVAAGVLLSPRLSAAHPQGLNYSYVWTAAPPTIFNCTADGFVFRNPGTTLDYYSFAPTFSLVYPFDVVDTNGQRASATVTIALVEVNTAPRFVYSIYNYSVREGTPFGEVVAAAGVNAPGATDRNQGDILVYRIASAAPAIGNRTFAMDPASGELSIGAAVTATQGVLMFDRALSYPRPQTFRLDLSARDSGVPALTGAAVAWVSVVAIAPRVQFAAVNAGGRFFLPGSPSAGHLVAPLGALTWTPYGNGSLVWSMSADTTFEGETAFTINPMNGEIRVANTTYYASNSTDGVASGGGSSGSDARIIGYGPPRFNYNTRNVFTANVTVTNPLDMDATTNLILTINLAHVNRAPAFTRNSYFFAKASEAAFIGTPLLPLVADPDVALGIGENFTFAIEAGNADNTFMIDAASGQIAVRDATTAAFLAPPFGPGFFNLSVSVRDRGFSAGPPASCCSPLTAMGWVYINVTDNNVRPNVTAARFAVDEYAFPAHFYAGYAPAGTPPATIVGEIAAVDFELTQRMTYSLSPRGKNINRPFPFNITTIPGGPKNQNKGSISVIAGQGPLDANAVFASYDATVSACDNHPTMPLCGTADVTIDLTWVRKPPFFDTTNRIPGAAVFRLKVDENATMGTNVSSVPLAGFSKDPARLPGLRYAWVNPGLNNSALFAVDAVTGMVTVATPNPALLDFNTQRFYSLTLRITDAFEPANVMTDTAAVVIELNDINNPARYRGLFGPDNATPLPALAVDEKALAGSLLGFARFTDQDADPFRGRMRFSFDPPSPLFEIGQDSGAITLSATGGMDYWDQTSYILTVSVTDLSERPITVTQAITINVIQNNTVAVAGFYIAPGVAPSVAVNVSASAYSSSHVGHDVLFSTLGNTAAAPMRVYIRGRGFGPTARRMGVPYSVSATYGPTGSEYMAGACMVEVRNTLISCAVAPGVGRDHRWRVTVNVPSDRSWTSPSSTAVSGYFPPAVLSVLKEGANPNDPSQHAITTRGSDWLVVTASNIGMSSDVRASVTLSYGSAALGGLAIYNTAPCMFVVNQSTVRCQSVEGVGAGLSFTLNVGLQSSAPYASSPVAYAPPAITSVSTMTPASVGSMGPFLLSTNAPLGEFIIVNGSNFGPPSTVPSLTYSKNFANASWYPVFTSGRCTMPADGRHTAYICPSAPGVGAGLRLRLEVGAQLSPITGPALTVSYRLPVISDLGGQGRDSADTSGGQEILLSGSQLGPETPVDVAGNPLPSFLQPRAFYGRAPSPLSGPLKYEAAMCQVTQQHARIRCMTAPGVGRDLVWRVVVGEQASITYTNQTSSYHPPIVASYAGAGSVNAITEGGQPVIVSGRNFGPMGTPIDLATYGNDENSTTFTAFNCSVLRPHTDVLCYTIVGAGAALKWKVTVDGQISVTPATSYGAPRIDSFSGPGAVDASTDGGDDVIISGYFLSVQQWLDKVTYGPSGVEYNPSDRCTLTVPHRQITCKTLPGAGRRHSWFITVGRQTSALGSLATSYAAPRIISITPSQSTTAGTTVLINGTNFAIGTGAGISILFNDGTAADASNPRPAQADIDDHYAAVAAGNPLGYKASVLAWLGRFQTLLPLRTYSYGRSLHGLDVILPPGFGLQREVIVVAGGVLSNIAAFNFSAPVVTNIAPDRQGVPQGMLRVQVDGSSFCNVNTHPGCGAIEVDGQDVTATVQTLEDGSGSRVWDHSYITFVIPDPSQGSSAKTLVVIVGGQRSAPRAFRKPVPNINALATQGVWRDMDTLGGQSFFIAGVMDIAGEAIRVTIGGRPCPGPDGGDSPLREVDNGRDPTDPLASFKLTCITPPGVGSGDLNPVIISSQTGNSSTATAIAVQYAPPRLSGASIVTRFTQPGRALQSGSGGAIPGGVPTLGAVIAVSGRYFGSAEVGGDPLMIIDADGRVGPCTVLARNDTGLLVALPPGDGAGHYMRFIVGTQASAPLGFDYSRPEVASVRPVRGPTVGGLAVSIMGANFGTSPNADVGSPMPVVTIGGRPCPITSPMPHANHSALTCTLPPGQGVGLPILLTVNGQTNDLSLASTTFSYLPPVVDSIAPASGPTSGRTRGAYVDRYMIEMTQGERIVMLLAGSNLGRSGEITFAPADEASAAMFDPIPPIPSSAALPMYTLNWLLARANGSLAAVAGMSLSDDMAAQLTAQALAAAGGNATLSTLPRAWNDTLIAFFMPEGFGENLRVNVTAGQPCGGSSAIFSYDPPVVNRVVNADFQRKENQCQPELRDSKVGYEARIRGAEPRKKMFYPGCYPTAGGIVLMLQGEGFGPQRLGSRASIITVGGKICRVDPTIPFTPDHNHLYCILASGFGQDLPVIVTVGGRSSRLTANSTMSYDPPALTGFDPNRPDARSVTRLGVKGTNFGDVPTPTTLLINDLPCDGVDFKGSDYLFCNPTNDVVGAKNVSILIANRTEPGLLYDVEEELVYVCKKDYYGLEGEDCQPCPQGGACPGDERFVDLLTATAGFWRINASIAPVLSEDATLFCELSRQVSRAAVGCPVIQPCEPVEACLANNICEVGYKSVDPIYRCATCDKGFYRISGKCEKCPDQLWLVYTGLVLLLFVVIALAYFLNKKGVSLSLLAIGIDYAQVVSLFARARIRWPEELLKLFRFLSIFNLNIEITAPECLSPNISYPTKWYFIEGLPLFVFGIFVIIHIIKIVYKWLCTSKSKKQLNAHLPTLVSTIIVIFRVLYLYLTRTSMDVLSCLATTPPEFRDRTDPKNPKDPILYMAGQIEYPCWRGEHLILFPLGLCTLLFYSITLPLLALWWLRKNRDAVKYDQILRCKNMGNDELSNPLYYRWRKMWSKLYVNYKPGKWYWELVVVARKFLIAICSLLFRQVGAYQLAMSLLVLFLAFVLQTHHSPYLTHENKPTVIAEHQAKAMSGDAMHARLEADMKAVEKRNFRKRQKVNLFAFDDMLAKGKKLDGTTMLVLWIFDANTVEAILLGSAVLVNLSGVMFDSARFAGDNFFVNQREYFALAVGAALLIVTTIIYYLICVLLELLVIFAPARIEPLVNIICCCCRAAIRRKLREQELKESALGKGKGRAMGRYSGRYSMAGMNANPLMLRAMGGGAGGPAVDGEDAGVGSDGLIQLDVVNAIDAPSKAVWAKVQQSYGRVFSMMDGLQHEIRLLKRQNAEATSSGPTLGAVPSTLSRNRRQFKPMQRALDEDEGAAAAAADAGGEASGPAPTLRSPGGASPAGHLAGMAGFASADTRRMRRTSTAAAARMNAAGAVSPAGAAAGGPGSRRGSRMSMSVASGAAGSPSSVLYPGDDDATGRSPLVGSGSGSGSPRSTVSGAGGRRSTALGMGMAVGMGGRRMTASAQAARASMAPRALAAAAAAGSESAVEIELSPASASARYGHDESSGAAGAGDGSGYDYGAYATGDAASGAAAAAGEGDAAYAYAYGEGQGYSYGYDESGADAAAAGAADPYYASGSGAEAAAGSLSRRGTYSAGRASQAASARPSTH